MEERGGLNNRSNCNVCVRAFLSASVRTCVVREYVNMHHHHHDLSLYV